MIEGLLDCSNGALGACSSASLGEMMKKLGAVVRFGSIALAITSLGGLMGCGGVDLACQTETCTGESTKTYKVCATTTGVTDKFGSSSCSCSTTAGSTCEEQCAQRVAVYCGNSPQGTDMAMHSCTMSASGAITATGTCLATTVFASGSNLGGPTLTMTSTGMGVTLEATLTRPGMVTSGAWSSSDAGAKGTINAVSTSGLPPPTWLAEVGGSDPPQGSYSMNLTVESSSTVSSGEVYIATGTITGTLAAVAQTGATGTIDFTASF